MMILMTMRASPAAAVMAEEAVATAEEAAVMAEGAAATAEGAVAMAEEAVAMAEGAVATEVDAYPARAAVGSSSDPASIVSFLGIAEVGTTPTRRSAGAGRGSFA